MAQFFKKTNISYVHKCLWTLTPISITSITRVNTYEYPDLRSALPVVVICLGQVLGAFIAKLLRRRTGL